MKHRYSRPHRKLFQYDGQRGIRVYQRWRGKNGFKHFIEDMGARPYPRASLHRINNDRGYSPRNVVWADARTQARHMRSHRVLVFRGQTMILVV